MSEQVTTNKPSNGKAIAALVLGIVSIVFCWVYGVVGLIPAIVGLILGISAKKTAPSGMATAGLVLSVIGLVLNAIILISCVACAGWLLSNAPKDFNWNFSS
jgi:hypothetical protein